MHICLHLDDVIILLGVEQSSRFCGSTFFLF